MKRSNLSLNFPKPSALHLRQFWTTICYSNHIFATVTKSLKNISKSQKNHKMKNSILLDSTWVDLHNKHIIWYVLVQNFCYSFKFIGKILINLKLQQKLCTKAHHIICSLCRSTHVKSNKIEFSILRFFYDLLPFFKDSVTVAKTRLL
jgi:hypothetical protein